MPLPQPRAAANARGRAMALPYQPQAGAGPRIRAAPKIRPNQAPLSKGARAEIGGLPSGKMPFPGARRTAAIQNRDVPAAAGSGGMRASRPTVVRVAAAIPAGRNIRPGL